MYYHIVGLSDEADHTSYYCPKAPKTNRSDQHTMAATYWEYTLAVADTWATSVPFWLLDWPSS